MTHGLALPKAATKGAQAITKAMDQLVNFVPHKSPQDLQQFAAGLVAECNRLPDDVTESSIIIGAMNCCVLGLMPGPALGHAHLVPFKEGSSKRATLVVGYKGFLKLAYTSGFLKTCQPELILKGEVVERWNDEHGAHFRHDISHDRDEPSRENIIGAYCSWQTTQGGTGVTFSTMKEIQRADRGVSYNTPWKTDYPAMVLKCPIRKASKLWLLTDQMAQAVMLDEEQERGVEQTALGRIEEGELDQTVPYLMSLLRDKCGCNDPGQEMAVVEWAVGASDTWGPDITVAHLSPEDATEVTKALMDWSKSHDGNGWDLVLPSALKRRKDLE